MKLYNTLTRTVEPFKPIINGQVKLYCCGPTVYDYMHIGNLRKFVFDDTLRRSLSVNGYDVKQVMNITDVGHLASDADAGEDKLEKGAKREGKSVWEVAKHYTDAFKHDIGLMNIQPPNGYHGNIDNFARATDFIDEQINIISILLEKAVAYKTKEAIYFDVTKLDDYGKLTGQKLSEKEIGVRDEVVLDDSKHSPQDFGLWFFTVGRFADHAMHWPSPWGAGFPGWHLECSAIIHATLGDPIDIHTGGVDNIGTHHVNEMAQTKAAYDNQLANYWVHSEHLHVDGQKMSKSLGNFYTLSDIVKKSFNPLALRLLFLQAHYRTQMNFTLASLEAASTNLSRIYAWADLVHQQDMTDLSDDQSQFIHTIKAALADDLNTPVALGILNQAMDKIKPTEDILITLDDIFGLNISSRSDITDIQKELIREREKARQEKNWSDADKLRDQLLEQGIEVSDTEHGAVWSRI